jgi:hypothetical protein
MRTSTKLGALSGAIWLLLIAALAIGALACVKGCAPAPAASAVTGSALARADARVESAIPHSDSTGQELLGMARKDLSVAAASSTETADRLDAAEQAKAALEGKWYVKGGRWAEHIWRGFKWLVALLSLAFIIGGVMKGQPGLVAQITGIIYQVGLVLFTFSGYGVVRVLRWAFGKWVAKKAKAPARRLRA